MEKLLTPSEAAEHLGIKVATLYGWARERRLPCQRLGRALRFSPSALEAWLATQATPAGRRVSLIERQR